MKNEIRNIETESKKDKTSVRCKVKINGKDVIAIVDSGAATGIITNTLQKQLGVKIIDASNAVFTIANGIKVAALGKTKIELEIGGKKINTEFEVIESPKKDLILGTTMFAELKGKIDFEKKELRMIINNELITIPINFEKQQKMKEENNEDIYEETNEQELYEESSESEEEIFDESDSESEKEFENEEYEKNSAYYLAELI